MRFSLMFLIALPLALCALNAPAIAHAKERQASTHTPKTAPNTQATSFLPQQAQRFQGTLLAWRIRHYREFNLRRVPTGRLYADLDRLENSLLRYKELNRPYHAPLGGPIALICVGAAGLAFGGLILALTFATTSFNPNFQGLLFGSLGGVGVGIVSLVLGIVWLLIQKRKRNRSPYLRRIRALQQIRKAIRIELRNRGELRRRRYGVHLPPVHGHGLTFSF